MGLINNILFQMVVYAIPIILATIGGLLAYRINVVNIGLEGFMIFGALFSSLVIYYTQSYFLGLVVAGLSGIILGLLFSLFSVTLKSNFVITGFAINILALSVGAFIVKSLRLTQLDISFNKIMNLKLTIPLIKDIPILGPILSGHSPMTYITVFLFLLVIVFLNKTKTGTYIKVIGENEEAAESVGLKITLLKYITLTLSALIVSLGGFVIAVEQIRLFTPEIIAGTGFIAIAAIYCGNGKPLLSSMYALIFGLTKSLSLNLAFGNNELEGILKIVPYITIIVVLLIVSLIQNKNKLERGVYESV